jgi:DNA-binding NarL/FixJ family response regulator
MVRLGVRQLLDGDFEVEEAESREEAVDLVRDIGHFEVAIIDMRHPGNGAVDPLSGQEAIRSLRRAEPSLAIVAHGARAERHLATAAIQAGASAYVSRLASAEDMQRAVMAAIGNEAFEDPALPPRGSRGKLTRRQREILQLLAGGESTTIAARQLELSEETVKTHTKNILARLEARNRAHAVAIGIRESLIE